MSRAIILDGNRYCTADKDVEVSRYSQLQQIKAAGQTDIIQPSDMGDAIREINKDDFDNDTRMSSIDMRTRLSSFGVTSVWAMDALVSMKCFPRSCLPVTRQFKRNMISMDGLGREDIVRMMVGNLEQKAKQGTMGFVDRVKNAGQTFFGGK